MSGINLPPDPIIPSGVHVTNVTMPEGAEGFFRDQSLPLEIGEDYIPTPLPGWNRQCRDEGGGMGLARGWNVIVGGATGRGKSLLALNIAAHAVKLGVNVGIISLEMSITQIKTRFYSILTDVPVRKLERGKDFDPSAGDDVILRLRRMRETFGAGRLDVNMNTIWGMDDVLKLMTHYVIESKCTLIIVDYLQLVTSGDERDLIKEVTKISHHMSAFAKRHRIVVLGLSQLNRATSTNRDVPPTPQGLIGASSLENDADQVILLDHSRYYNDLGKLARTWLITGKNRHGPEGELPILWDFKTLTIREGLEDEVNDWPGMEKEKKAKVKGWG